MCHRLSYKDRRAFTLIELLIYIGMSVLLLSVIGTIGLNILLAKAKLSALDEVSQNGRQAVGRIAGLINSANNVSAPVTGTIGTSLTLAMPDAGVNPTIIDLSGGAVRVKQGSGAAQPVTTSEVQVTALNFFNLSSSTAPQTIRVQLGIKYLNPSGRAEYNVAENYYTTANIRKR